MGELIVRSEFDRVAAPVPPAAPFNATHEMDPQKCPDLQDLFLDTGAAAFREESSGGGPIVPILQQALQGGSGSPFEDERDAHVVAAIDEAMAPHHANIEPRLAALP